MIMCWLMNSLQSRYGLLIAQGSAILLFFCRDGDEKQKQRLYKHSLKNSDLALQPVFGVLLQPRAGKVARTFLTYA